MMKLRFHHNNLTKHGVTEDEVEECFRDQRRLIRRIGAIYWLVAKTDNGRILNVGFRKESERSYFIFHAMPAREYEKRQYKLRGK